MNNDLWKGLSEEEAEKARDAMDKVEQEIQAARDAVALEPVQKAYERERDAIARSGVSVGRRNEQLADLKIKYRAKGLQV